MQDMSYLFLGFIAMGVISYAQRALPFAASTWLQRQRWARVLADFLPLAIMLILVVHSSTEAALSHGGLPIPEIVAVVSTLLLQWFLRNSLLSIFSGTLIYVLLLNLGFL